MKESPAGYWYVVSTYSHTDRRHLIQIHSRRFVRKEDAEFHRDFLDSEQVKKTKTFGLIYQETSEGVLS